MVWASEREKGGRERGREREREREKQSEILFGSSMHKNSGLYKFTDQWRTFLSSALTFDTLNQKTKEGGCYLKCSFLLILNSEIRSKHVLEKLLISFVLVMPSIEWK